MNIIGADTEHASILPSPYRAFPGSPYSGLAFGKRSLDFAARLSSTSQSATILTFGLLKIVEDRLTFAAAPIPAIFNLSLGAINPAQYMSWHNHDTTCCERSIPYKFLLEDSLFSSSY
jgi:hypothetical protein